MYQKKEEFMKKKFIALNLILCLSFLCVCLTGCSSPSITQLVVEYTPDIQFFIGEDWHDDLIKGTATYSDDSEKDVTANLKIDTSNYDKSKVGKYDILFEYDDIKVKYQVNVVEEMTHLTSIKKRIDPCFQKAFKVQNGALEFTATASENAGEGLYLKQTLQYKLENNTLKEYYKIEYVGDSEENCEVVCEILYIGDLTNGTLTPKTLTTDDETPTSESIYYYDTSSIEGTWAEFEEAIPEIATLYGASTYVDASQFLNFYTLYYPNLTPVKLTKSTNTYTITLSNNLTIIIDSDGYISEYCGIEISKTTNIPSALTTEE